MELLAKMTTFQRVSKIILAHFVIAACTLLAATASAQVTDFSPPQENRIKELVREYILENPEIIAEAITLLQANQESAKLERQQQNLAQLQAELIDPPEKDRKSVV